MRLLDCRTQTRPNALRNSTRLALLLRRLPPQGPSDSVSPPPRKTTLRAPLECKTLMPHNRLALPSTTARPRDVACNGSVPPNRGRSNLAHRRTGPPPRTPTLRTSTSRARMAFALCYHSVALAHLALCGAGGVRTGLMPLADTVPGRAGYASAVPVPLWTRCPGTTYIEHLTRRGSRSPRAYACA